MSQTPVQVLPPEGRPRIGRAQLEALIRPLRVDVAQHPLVVVGVRGYFSAGRGGNVRGVYDDALCVYAPSLDLCTAFNGNTDPSRLRPGSGTGAGKGMAVLNPGIWYAHRFDIHGGKVPHEAICQRVADVTVTRDGHPPYADSGRFGINIHRGGFTVTSSEGCQTVPPQQWDEFIGTARQAAQQLFGTAWRQRTIAYALIDRTENNPFTSPEPAAELAVQWADAGQFRRELIRPTLQKMGYHSLAAEELLLGTALAESNLKARRQFGDGPARGLFQMEPATHDDLWANYLKFRPQLGAAVRLFIGQARPSADLLEFNDAYACAMARTLYLRVPKAVPAEGDLPGQAAYWKQHYNTPGGKGTVEHYLAAARSSTALA